MRILLVSMEYPPETSWGGIGVYVDVMGHALAERGHEVHVLSCVPGQEERDYDDRGVQVHRRGAPWPPLVGPLMSRPAAPYRALVRLNAAVGVWRAFRSLPGRFDIVEIPDWYAEGLLLALARPAPVVAHLHGPLRVVAQASGRPLGPSGWLAERLERTAVRLARMVVSPSQRVLDALPDGWVGRRPAVVLHHPIDLEAWHRASPDRPTGPVVTVVGTLQHLKGQHLVIEAAARLAPDVPGLELVFAGRSAETVDGRPYSEMLASLAAERGVHLTLPGHVSRAELAAIYARSRVVAVPSYHETFSNVGMEALAAGRPVVCTSTTGLAELADGSPAITVVGPGDAAQLAEALRPLLTAGPDAAAGASDAALSLAQKLLSRSAISQDLEALYIQILAP